MDTFVTVIGNLTADPELRFTRGGVAVADFRLAVTPPHPRGDAWKDGETSFLASRQAGGGVNLIRRESLTDAIGGFGIRAGQ